jgi:pimeloyl-ACP methyl ester carboxylesterase/DNA-binding CsgD family transcriptional regulator
MSLGPLSRRLREGLAEGRATEALLDGWTSLEASVVSEPEALAAVLREAARMDTSQGFAAVTPTAAVGGAVITAAGETVHADPAFTEWFGRPAESLAFRRLARHALKSGQMTGLVEARDGSVVAAAAGLPEVTGGWPMSPECRAAIGRPGRHVGLLAFAPSKDSALAAAAAEAFGLTPLEARLAEALISAPDLNTAAQRIGVGRETARDALRKAMRKTGAKRSPDLVRRVMDLMVGMHPPSGDTEAVLQTVFGATPAEARAAAKFAEGLSAQEVAAALGVKEATVRGYLKSVFLKTGVRKAKDLVRLAAETSALASMTTVSETVMQPPDLQGRLRAAPAGAHDRKVAFVDYGPRGGKPLLVLHGFSTGRTLPPPFVDCLRKAGYRAIVPQRPGFGLTDPAVDDYLKTAADDMAVIVDTLKLRMVDILGRDASSAAALAFAEHYPDRVGKGVLLNPRPPKGALRPENTLMGSVSRMLMGNPQMIAAFNEMLRRQTRTDLLRAMMRASLNECETDRKALEDPLVLDQLVRDAQANSARSSAGPTAEMTAYSMGWRVPETVGGHIWTLAWCEALKPPTEFALWERLPNLHIRLIKQAGMLAYFTHPEVILSLVTGK